MKVTNSKEISSSLPLHEHANKRINSIDECNEIIKAEIRFVKCLPSNTTLQIARSYLTATICMSDSITSLKDADKVAADELKESKILTIRDMLITLLPTCISQKSLVSSNLKLLQHQ